MTLSNLTTSGWVFLALTLAVALAFVRGLVKRNTSPEQPLALAFMIAWLLWLVTP